MLKPSRIAAQFCLYKLYIYIWFIWYYVVGSRNLVQSLRTTSLPRMVQLSYALIVRSPYLSEYSTQCQGVCKGVSTEIASQTSAWLLTWYKCSPLHYIWWEFWCVFSSTSTFSVMDFRVPKKCSNRQWTQVFEPSQSSKHHLYPTSMNHSKQNPISHFQEAKELGS